MGTSRSRSSRAASLRKDGLERGDGPAAPFRRVLIANRGEIALRIIRACHELGIEAVAVYSDVDRESLHVRAADLAVRIGPAAPAESYLRADALIEAAIATAADAVHPGYGFLAERAAFARAVNAAGLVFVGPPADVIDALGDKLHARRTARDAGVAAVPGTLEAAAVERPDQLASIVADATSLGFPLLVKAAAGGGGRGMRRVERVEDLPAALASGSHEAAAAFGDGAVYLEREIAPARHIEVQLLGDAGGQVVAIGERDCSLQRRHQKLVEEAPAPGLTPAEREHLHDLAVRVGSAAGLVNAATAEFLRAPDGSFYFLEVNTRLQVEHGITELVSGVDIVREQLLIAGGRPLSASVLRAAEKAAVPAGHAIEVRLTAEDPGNDFAGSPGRVTRWRMPAGPGIRVDTAIEAGARVPPDYDNLIAKVMVHAHAREAAIDRLRRALDEIEIAGIQTTLPFHRFVARHPGFRAGELSTGWVAEEWQGPTGSGTVGRARAAGVAMVAAGVAGLEEGPAGATAAPAADLADRRRGPASPNGQADGAWHRAGLDEAVDRWPR
jgi:acetyl/propionyl-CoA carboxylase alpha subunit